MGNDKWPHLLSCTFPLCVSKYITSCHGLSSDLLYCYNKRIARWISKKYFTSRSCLRSPCEQCDVYCIILIFTVIYWNMIELHRYRDSFTNIVYLRLEHGLLTRYAKLLVAHAPGMPGTFFPPPRFSDADMHHGTCVTHVSWCLPGSLTSDFLWIRWRGKRYRHSRPMPHPQCCVSGMKPMEK